jgi:hypothetical protein
MANPFFTKMPTSNGINMGQVKQIYNMLRYSNNPNQMLDQLVSQNPQMAQAINLIKSNGNYEQVFRSMCKEKGINADDLIKQLNS